MTTEQENKNTKAIRNYWVDMISFLPFLFLLTTGVIMLMYHTGKPYSVETIGLNGETWMIIHKTLTVIALPLIIVHLFFHIEWLKKLFRLTLKSKYKGINVTLFVLFVLCVLTSLLSWLVFNDSNIGKAMRGIHNKFGILLIVFFVIHISNYFKWIVNMTRRIMKKKNNQ